MGADPNVMTEISQGFIMSGIHGKTLKNMGNCFLPNTQTVVHSLVNKGK
jgi:hypothetical protein